MAVSSIAKTNNLNDFIIANQHRIEFFQLMRLLAFILKKEFPDQSWEESFDKYIRIRPSLSISFPDHSINSVQLLGDNKVSVETTFFGLYGVTSPLPNFYSEDLLAYNHDGLSFARRFFDIFHYAMYPVLLGAMTRYRVSTGLQEGTDIRQRLRRASWLGISTPQLAERLNKWPEMLKIASLLSTAYSSVTGLEALIATLIGSGSVNVVACPVVRSVIPEQYCFSLGKQANQLGSQAVLGRTLNRSSNNHIDIQLSDQLQDDILSFLPGGSKFELLKQAIVLYVPVYLKLCLRVKANTWPSKISETALGYGASLGSRVRVQNLAVYIT